MGLKYMCDRCEKKEGIYEMPDGWYCLGCYSGHADWDYQKMEERKATGW